MADRGFIQFLCPHVGFRWLGRLDRGFRLGRSDRGPQHSHRNFFFSLFCARCHAVKKMTRNSEAPELDVAISLLFFLVSARFCFDTDVGNINISLIVILNAKTQYHAIP